MTAPEMSLFAPNASSRATRGFAENLDLDPSDSPDLTLDVRAAWLLAEHMCSKNRDAIQRAHKLLRDDGLVFTRVPHCSMQRTRVEHHARYGIHAATILCHGRKPLVTMFRAFCACLATSIDFHGGRSLRRTVLKCFFSACCLSTESVFCRLVGGIDEVQFLPQEVAAGLERRLRPTDEVSA
jgi:hypothetical protein